ncbi:MAG: NAD+ synthase [Nitrospirota bacterium]
MPTIRIALAQINSTVGDLAQNTQKIIEWIAQAKKKGADIVAFPELSLTGYPPEDLLLKPHFIRDNQIALKKILPHCAGITAIIGFVDQSSDTTIRSGRSAAIHNAAAVIQNKKIGLLYHKQHLPNYGVFDEARYFQPGNKADVFVLNNVTIGVNICEDIWVENGPAQSQTQVCGADLIINISASPYRTGVMDVRENLLATRARENQVHVAYVNLVGGQDELVFDGGSLIFDQTGKMIAREKSFEEAMTIADLSIGKKQTLLGGKPTKPDQRSVYKALKLGLFDYVQKNRFDKVVIGLSGGIDSALTAIIAADTLGPKRVIGVFMPSRYTSKESVEDVEKLAGNLGIRLETISIEPSFCTTLNALSEMFKNRPADQTEENLQSRIRGNMMMALSNKFGWLVLTTGNKSEMSVGYATLYGDMAGGFAVIKDLWKTVVYQVARDRNKDGHPIPKRVLTRPPTAELRFNQADTDSLPPYDVLDPILAAYIEEDCALEQIVAMGFEEKTVAKVIALVDNSEFKRRQSPIGVRITHKGLGKDRRMPITNNYRNY